MNTQQAKFDQATKEAIERGFKDIRKGLAKDLAKVAIRSTITAVVFGCILGAVKAISE